MASVDSKSFLGLLNGLARRTYHGDTDLTDELLHSELFPDSSKDDFESTVHKAMGMMKVFFVKNNTRKCTCQDPATFSRPLKY